MIIIINARFLTQQLTGVQRFAIELSLQLKSQLGKEIIFVTPNNIKQKDYADKLNAVIIGKHTGHLWEQWDLPLWLHKHEKPLLLCLGNTAPIIWAKKMTALHDITFLRFPNTFSWKFLLFYKLIIPRVLRTSQKVFTVSNFSLNEISNVYKISPKKISVIYNAVSLSFHPIVDQEIHKEKYILAVSSVKSNKNFPAAVQAYILAQKDIPNLKLYIIGDIKSNSFNIMPELITTCKNHPGIKLLGRVNDEELIKYYSNAFAFIFPSLYEGFGIPVIEAQACGCPVIASNSSSMPEILENSALLCNPYNINDFATAIKDLTYNKVLRERLIIAGYKNVKRFTWEKSAETIINSLKKQIK